MSNADVQISGSTPRITDQDDNTNNNGNRNTNRTRDSVNALSAGDNDVSADAATNSTVSPPVLMNNNTVSSLSNDDIMKTMRINQGLFITATVLMILACLLFLGGFLIARNRPEFAWTKRMRRRRRRTIDTENQVAEKSPVMAPYSAKVLERVEVENKLPAQFQPDVPKSMSCHM